MNNPFEVDVIQVMQGQRNLTIYVDGGCHNRGKHKGVGAWAFKLLEGDKVLAKGSQGLQGTTNNRTELTAVLEALRHLRGMGTGSDVSITVITDSKYVVDIWNKYLWRWQGSFTGLANQDLLQVLWDEYKCNQGRYKFTWVKGHSGVTHNEAVDQMCTQEIDKIISGRS